MTIRQGNPSRISPLGVNSDRSKIRSLLRKGGAGNACAFTQATSAYFEFLSEFYYLLGHTDHEDRITQIRTTLFDCWRYAPYIRRVSDFERFIEIKLEKQSGLSTAQLPEPYSQLNDLSHTQRFLLIARTYQNWSYRALRLSTRIKKHDLSRALVDLKCSLIGFKPQMLKTSQQALLLKVNDLLEGELKTRDAREVEKEILKQKLILQFKAEWLEYRCELAELKQQMSLDSDSVDAFKSRLTEELQEIPIEQPNFTDSLINQFSFSRIPSA